MDNVLENNPLVATPVDPVVDSQILSENVNEIDNPSSVESINSEDSQEDSNEVNSDPLDQSGVDPVVPIQSLERRVVRAKSYDDLPDLFKQHDNLFFKTALGFKSGDPIDVWFEVITDPKIAELVNSINSARNLLASSGLQLRGL